MAIQVTVVGDYVEWRLAEGLEQLLNQGWTMALASGGTSGVAEEMHLYTSVILTRPAYTCSQCGRIIGKDEEMHPELCRHVKCPATPQGAQEDK